MRPICLALCLTLATPAAAEEPTDWQGEIGRLLREFEGSLRPALDEMIRGLGVLNQIDSFEHYAPPQVLENGDIIIRRRPEAPRYRAPDADPLPGIET